MSASQRYYQAHKDQRRAYGREYYQRNRDKILAAATKKRARTPAPATPTPAPVPQTVPESRAPSPLREHKRRGILHTQNTVLTFN
jgi:hypothetical protein